jgi:hypothetical protein
MRVLVTHWILKHQSRKPSWTLVIIRRNVFLAILFSIIVVLDLLSDAALSKKGSFVNMDSCI